MEKNPRSLRSHWSFPAHRVFRHAGTDVTDPVSGGFHFRFDFVAASLRKLDYLILYFAAQKATTSAKRTLSPFHSMTPFASLRTLKWNSFLAR